MSSANSVMNISADEKEVIPIIELIDFLRLILAGKYTAQDERNGKNE